MNRNIVTRADAEKIREIAYAQNSANEGVGAPKLGSEKPMMGGAASSEIKPDEWYQRLAKFIPSEALSLYLAAAGAVPSTQMDRESKIIWLLIVLAVAVLFNVLYLKRIWKVQRVSQVAVSSFALVIFAFSTGGELVRALPFYEPWRGSLVLIFTTAFLAFFSPPEAAPISETKP
jgi:hypothetical protein